LLADRLRVQAHSFASYDGNNHLLMLVIKPRFARLKGNSLSNISFNAILVSLGL